MFHYLFGTLFLIVTVVTFNQQYCLKGALHAYYGLYKGVVERSVIAYKEHEASIEPYFDLDLLTWGLHDYLEANLKPYCIEYHYYIVGVIVGDREECNKVRITIEADIYGVQRFKRLAVFEIKDNTI